MIRRIFWLIFGVLFISCSSRENSDNSDTSEEIMENEIWNPYIILSQEETKIVTAKATMIIIPN